MNKDHALIWLFIANALIDVALIAGVVCAAVYFSKPGLLWWLLLLPFVGMTLKREQKGDAHE